MTRRKMFSTRTCFDFNNFGRGKGVGEVIKPRVTTNVLNIQARRHFTKPLTFSAFLLTSLFIYRALNLLLLAIATFS